MVEPPPDEPPRHSRPPAPRVWHVVGIVGRVLIALGLLLLLFVAYQLWGTNLQYSRSQDSLRDEFEQARSTTTTLAAPTTTSASTSVAATTTSAPTTALATTTTTTVAPAPPQEGDVLARLEIPSIGVDAYVVEGVEVPDLRRGPGHFVWTPLPGQIGNTGLAGHRTTYGAPFSNIDHLAPDDEIDLTTVSGSRYVYRVSAPPFVVGPDDVNVLADTPGRATVTLVSCHPKYTARQRIVVQAALDGAASAPPIPRPSPTTVPAPTTSVPPTTGPGQPTTTTGGVTATTTTTTTILPVLLVPGGDLTGGWFADTGAWPGVVLWGLAAAAAVVLGWWIGRHTRVWAGVVAMAVPFLVLLYFFFENVNRLLPANL